MAGDDSRLPPHVLKLEIELTDPSTINNQATQCLENECLKDVLSSDELNSSPDSDSSSGSDSPLGNPTEVLDEGSHSNCQTGREAYINLMLPDRSVHIYEPLSFRGDVLPSSPMDVQLCVFDSDEIVLEQQPQVLRAYAHSLRVGDMYVYSSSVEIATLSVHIARPIPNFHNPVHH